MTDPAMTAALHQLTETRERLAVLDAREADHFKAIGEKLTELGSLTAELGGTLRDQGVILSALQDLDEKVARLAARVAEILPGENGDAALYRPGPAPRWWKLPGQARERALDKLRAWVAEVYRPGYGQLAATLGPCWDQHPLCLYGLDILSELWSLLYLQAQRHPATLSAQAEFQARILPALAEQLLIETSRCGHAQGPQVHQRLPGAELAMTATNSGPPRLPTGDPRFRIDRAAAAAGISRTPANRPRPIQPLHRVPGADRA